MPRYRIALKKCVFGRLSKYRAERVEEHVLFCRECQERMAAEMDFARAMRMAANISGTKSSRKKEARKTG